LWFSFILFFWGIQVFSRNLEKLRVQGCDVKVQNLLKNCPCRKWSLGYDIVLFSPSNYTIRATYPYTCCIYKQAKNVIVKNLSAITKFIQKIFASEEAVGRFRFVPVGLGRASSKTPFSN
jgi:hypothetical protein